jgi:hypothetical protein
MATTKLLVVVVAGLAAAACSSTTTTYERQAAVPVGGSERACMDYGFRPGTDAYNRCVVREADARAGGRVPQYYTAVQLAQDARNACYSYGLAPGTAVYDRCVTREIEARRYREQAYSPQPTYYPSNSPPAGVEAFRDEFGFRYDGLGNRLDRNGNIISPQSTTP